MHLLAARYHQRTFVQVKSVVAAPRFESVARPDPSHGDARVVRRTVRRRLRRQVLWNGNLERPLWTVFTNPEHIVRWAWSSHHRNARRVAAVHEQYPELVIVRLADQRTVRQWLNGPLKT